MGVIEDEFDGFVCFVNIGYFGGLAGSCNVNELCGENEDGFFLRGEEGLLGERD